MNVVAPPSGKIPLGVDVFRYIRTSTVPVPTLLYSTVCHIDESTKSPSSFFT
jgi:hypothetical protein